MRFAYCLFVAACGAAQAQEPPLIAPFSQAAPGEPLPPGWVRTDIKGVARRTTYRLVTDEGLTVLRADADRAASALVYRVASSPAVELDWRWKAANVLKTSDPTAKEGDDYVARVYVIFDYPLARLSFADRVGLRIARAIYGADVPAAALCYVWDSRLPAGTVLESPYTSRVRIVVAESGARNAGRWVAASRDVAADFRRAFGEEPPAISAVALATDTDNTGEKATAWYGDIALKKPAVTGAIAQ